MDALRIPTREELSHEEVAFLAWFFVAVGRRESHERIDGLAMKIEWEDHTGQELPDEFLNSVCAIYDAQ